LFFVVVDTASVVQFLNDVDAKGGEGYCADVFGGLEEALNMDWKHPTRVILHSDFSYIEFRLRNTPITF
jgi:hypothetical protein